MGLLRLYLALCVISAHTVSFLPFSLLGGRGAVVIFYVISGFYMAMILNRRYVGAESVKRFYLSRMLRLLLPFVFATTLMAVLCVLCSPLEYREFLKNWQSAPLILQVSSLISNIGILGQDAFWLIKYTPDSVNYAPYQVDPQHNGYNLLWNSPIFSVALAFYFYLLAPFVLRNFQRCLLFLAAGLSWYAVMHWLKLERLDTNYHLWPATWIYFALGGASWWLSQNYNALQPKWIAAGIGLSLCILVVPLILSSQFVLMMAVVIAVLFHSTKSLRFDRWCGDISYGVYILHMWVIKIIHPMFSENNFELAASVMATTIGLAALLHYGFERQVNKWRYQLCLPVDLKSDKSAIATTGAV